MARIYEQYITGEDREFAIMEAESSLFNDKIDFMLETIERERELNKREAEYIVLKESGTYDDLMYLYEEADKEADAKKQGVIGTIVAAIKGIINAIGTAFSNFGKVVVAKNPDQEIEVEKDGFDAIQEVQSAWNSNLGKGIKTAIKVIAGIMGVGVAGAVVNHVFANFGKKNEDPNKQVSKIKIKARELDEKICKPVQSIMDKIKEFIGKFSSGKKDSGEENKDANKDQNANNDANNKEEITDEKAVSFGHKVLAIFQRFFGQWPILGKFINKFSNKNGNNGEPNPETKDETPAATGQTPTDQGGGDTPGDGVEQKESSDDVLEDIDAFLESLMDTEYDDEMVEESYDEDEDILGALDAIFA